jgi:hypothetical protein
MSLSESPDETREKATVLTHLARASFPADNLAPWMSILKERQAVVLAGMKTIGKIGKELDRRAWLDKHPGEELPEEEAEEEPEFLPERVRGPSGMFGFCVETLAQDIHNVAPSINGIGRKQAIGLGQAQKSGVAVEPQKRTLWEKMTGKGKDKEQVSGGT